VNPISFDTACYRIGDEPVYLNSGEFHYFRVPREDWRRRMDLFRQAGGNCVATYCPWLIHEPREGEFVFDRSEGMYDLEGFLETASEAGLYVIARPGPYQYSELVHAGLPGWLVTDYPQLLARRRNGEPIGPYAVSYVHPLLLEKTRVWFDRVLPIIARYTTSRDGPVAMVQIDNELTGVHLWRGSADYNPESMGFGDPQGRWPTFLRDKYGTIEVLNNAYETNWPDFASVQPVEPNRYSLAQIRCAKDYFSFYLDTIAEYCEVLIGMIRGHGIDVPIVHNSGNANMDALFEATVERLGNKEFLLGTDHYYNLEGYHNPTPEYAGKVFYSCEMLRLMGFPPTVFELPSGQNFDYPPVLVEDELASYMTNLAMGMKGHNYYIYTGGPNPPSAGTTGDVYDFNAPVGAENEVRPLYHTQKRFAEFIAERPMLLHARREHDVRAALDFELARSPYYWKRRGEVLLSDVEAWNFLNAGLLFSAFSASVSPVLEDLSRDDWLGDTDTPVMVACSSAMPEASQHRLVRFLQAGGRVLLSPVLPTLDENLQPCTVLADFLGGPRVRRHEGEPARPVFGPNRDIAVYGAQAFVTDNLPADAEILGVDEHTGEPLAWMLCCDGGGTVAALTVRWAHKRHHHHQMLRSVLDAMGLRPKVRCSNPYLWSSLRTADDRSVLFLINLFSGALSAEVSCTPAWSSQPVEQGAVEVPPMTVLPIDLGAND